MKANSTTSANETSRTVLMVDGHGHIRTIRKFHQKLWIGIGVAIGSVLIAAGAAWLYVEGLQTQQALQQRIENLTGQLAEAEHQKELLLARAVKAESRIAPPEPDRAAPTRPAPTSRAKVSAPVKDDPIVPPATKPAPVAAVKKTEKPSPPAPVKAVKPPPVISVAVEKLKVAYQVSEKTLATEFVIRNTGSTQAQGRAVVVLSSSEGATSPRLSLPPVPLKNDRPRGNRGRRFSISRFMRLNLKRKVAEPGLRFDTADVFVFDMKGKLLQEKTFEVAVKVPEAPPPKPAAVAPPPKPSVVAPPPKPSVVAPPPKPAPVAPPPEPVVATPPPNPAAAAQPPQPAASEPAAGQTSNPILNIPSNSEQESQGGQED